ncbi:hypothetical protein GWR56_08925 [Mucilaginibacter sp. 14171R-50]|uniref:hypothetical protein n=1 Tax=Mucilaginibacter sp. 14171R-50 TaxID=2703789 RepID=UPI00138D249E|nr:hypothetical protein [Mucilaginibacter sp. 14171R-50]QHS55655.1 hypothetical protein GWR56_08925 [Mucilaginibacter sp. 14171R-50]
MMKYLYVLILLVFYNSSFAQQINGVEGLQIGKTESEVLSALKIDPSVVIDGSLKTMKFIEKNKDKVFKVIYDPLSPLVKSILDSKLDLDASLNKLYIKKCKDAVSYSIPKYEVYGTTLNNIILTFYKGSLIKILTVDSKGDNNQFLAVFESKYGEGEVNESKSVLDACGNYSLSKSNTWKTGDPDILAINVKHDYCIKEDDQPKQVIENRFVIQYSALYEAMLACAKTGETIR